MNSNIEVINNVISLNPTGTMDYNGTYKLKGNNNIVNSPATTSKKNLKKTQNNEIVCSSIENFENYDNNLNNENNKKFTNILILVFFIILLILIFLFYL